MGERKQNADVDVLLDANQTGKHPTGKRHMYQHGFGSMQAVRVAGISYRQLDHWASLGLVKPSLVQAAGSGSRRVYSYSNLVALRAIKRMLDAGLRLAKIRSVISNLDSEFGVDLASSNLVIDGTTPVLVNSKDELFDLLKQGQGVLNVLPMVPIQKEVDSAISSLFTDDQSQSSDMKVS